MSPTTAVPDVAPPPILAHEQLERLGSREQVEHRLTEGRLQAAPAREDILLRQRAEMIAEHELVGREADHRILNDLQMISSLLSLQSRRSGNAEAAAQLSGAANRVATIKRVHQRLHGLDGLKTVAFRQYLEDVCHDIAQMMFHENDDGRGIDVEACDAELPTATAIPLGFVVNELLTNAAKYGAGRIAVRLAPCAEGEYALSVSNDGAPLPAGFDQTSKGLGMRIVKSFVEKIHGTLRIELGDDKHGPMFEVRFS